MKYLIRSARILDPDSPLHRKVRDILIEGKKIAKIGEGLKAPDAREIHFPNLHLSPGWFDLYANFCEPGYEHREEIRTGLNAAAAGGFTAVLIRPDTRPALHGKSEIEFVINKARGHAVALYPMGAVTRHTAGAELTEMMDLHHAGAAAFSNGEAALESNGILLRSLQYLQAFDGVLIYRPLMQKLADGPVHESRISAMLGMKGSPALAEELAVNEAIELARYTGTRMHLVKVSTAGSVSLIRQAKKEGLRITASVAAHHLLLDEESLLSFDENYKVSPPLRGKKDVKALRKALIDGVIDAVVSDHEPLDPESKQREFEFAAPGMAGIETCFPLAMAALPAHMDTLLHALIRGPRQVLGMEVPVIEEGAPAELTLFDPELEWVPSEHTRHSKAFNHPLLNTRLKGKTLAIFSRAQYVLSA